VAQVQRRSESVAAAVNGLLVVSIPLVLLVAGSSIDLNTYDATVTARAPGPPRIVTMIPNLNSVALVLLPFALLAAWRTWVYAGRWRDRQDPGWRGVAEAAACGGMVALLYLAPGIVTRPDQAPPYVLVYGGAALLMGAAVGLFLRATALVVLKLGKPDRPPIVPQR
jgi:hypothetical protein